MHGDDRTMKTDKKLVNGYRSLNGDAKNKQSKFETELESNHLSLRRRSLSILQVNMGKLCNQACHHCHVDAGPNRTEIMEKNTVDRLVELLEKSEGIETVDLTGGAPEMNPWFRYFVAKIRALRIDVIDRCNLTILLEPGQEDTAEFLRDHKVQVVSSLPCYSQDNVDKQRGNGVFMKSVVALHLLNDLGYGKPRTGLKLDLVYNPVGASLPPSQGPLEAEYKERLYSDFEIEFNQLYTITNMPIKRFQHLLERTGQLESYSHLLQNTFNQTAAEEIMCRDLVSIGWDGKIYDCDFNQMLELPIRCTTKTIWDIEHLSELEKNVINFEDHCFGCTAGEGSSCSGALVKSDHEMVVAV